MSFNAIHQTKILANFLIYSKQALSCTHGYIKCRLTVLFAGTSNDGHTVTFTSTKLYTESYRFMKDTVLQINGSFINRGDNSVYSGSITLPVNSSFQQFFMVKGKI